MSAIKPCPFCGGECERSYYFGTGTQSHNYSCDCGYESREMGTKSAAIAAHNRVAAAVDLVREIAASHAPPGCDMHQCGGIWYDRACAIMEES